MSVVTEGTITYYPGYQQVQVQQNVIIQQISSISNNLQAIIGTVNVNNYLIGQKVTFRIPGIFGMQQINNLVGIVIGIISSTQFVVNVNTLSFEPFSIPISLPSAYTPPYVIPYCSGPQIPITYPLPNQTSFDGTIYNNGQF